jgi:hypothetical protein
MSSNPKAKAMEVNATGVPSEPKWRTPAPTKGLPQETSDWRRVPDIGAVKVRNDPTDVLLHRDMQLLLDVSGGTFDRAWIRRLSPAACAPTIFM